MMEKKEVRPKSFRITDETADKFKEISASIGGNQQETLAKLIEAYEFQAGKATLTEKKADIEQFEKYITVITRMYMTSLEDNQNISETVKSEYEAQLKAKDNTIIDLQNKINELSSLKSENDSLEQEIDHLNSQVNQLKDNLVAETLNYKNVLSDKDKLITTMGDNTKNLKQRITYLEVKSTQVDELSEKIVELEHTNNNLKAKIENDRILKDRDMFELEKKHMVEIENLKAEKQKIIDEYQAKYKDLLDRIMSSASEIQEVDKNINS